MFIYLYTEFFFFFFLNKFFFKQAGFFKFYLLHYLNFKPHFIFISDLYTKFIFYTFLYSKSFFQDNLFFVKVYYFYLKRSHPSHPHTSFTIPASLPFCYFNVFSFSFLCHVLKFNQVSLNKPFLELVIFSSLKEEISFIQIFNLTMILHFFPLLQEFKNNKYTKESFMLLLRYLNTFPLKSKKNISFIRFNKIISRLNDNFIRKGRSLMRLRRLINSLHK